MDLRTTPILASFDAAPPVTLATRSCASSFFSSSSVFSSSLLFLVRSSCALIFIAASRMASRPAAACGWGGAGARRGAGARIARSKPSREDLGGRLRRRRPLTHGRACRLQHARPCHSRRRRSQARARAAGAGPGFERAGKRAASQRHGSMRRRTQPDARARPVVAGSAVRGARGHAPPPLG